MGVPGQEVLLDGVLVPAPEGTLLFTGPGGCLLELKQVAGAWVLVVDGQAVEAHNAAVQSIAAASAPSGLREPVAPAAMTSLPQGVSLDVATGKYTANIRLNGRFLNLGSFATPEEASARYQQQKSQSG